MRVWFEDSSDGRPLGIPVFYYAVVNMEKALELPEKVACGRSGRRGGRRARAALRVHFAVKWYCSRKWCTMEAMWYNGGIVEQW